ncbi:hypothetical protein GXB82_21980 [Pseudomonas stutzeri]|nr:hypothetical protein [Stutzerimonas stutzeri]
MAVERYITPESALVESKLLYRADADFDDDDKPFTRLTELHIRTVQRRTTLGSDKKLTAFAWEKIPGATWGKLSTKTGDYGWFPNADPCFRTKLVAGENFPPGVATTKLAAWQHCLKSVKARLKRAKEHSYGEDYENDVIALIALVERRISAERSAKTKNKQAVAGPASS